MDQFQKYMDGIPINVEDLETEMADAPVRFGAVAREHARVIGDYEEAKQKIELGGFLYKREEAKKYIDLRSRPQKPTEGEIKALLDNDPELRALKDDEANSRANLAGMLEAERFFNGMMKVYEARCNILMALAKRAQEREGDRR